MPRHLYLAPLALAVLLSACANRPALDQPVMGALNLHTPLRIEPDAATIRLQYGQVVARNAVQEHNPFCVFEVENVRTEAQAVMPGRFEIVSISRSVESIAGLPPAPYAGLLRRVNFGDDDAPSHLYYKTIFRLRGTPQVSDSAHTHPVTARALTCMSNQYMPGNPFMRHLTLGEIRTALGTLFSFNPQ
jgi:hypothetical protein